MIEFFEMLNGVSGLRTITYLVFILILSYVILVGLSDILRIILGKEKPTKVEDSEDNNDDDPTQPWNWRKEEDKSETLN